MADTIVKVERFSVDLPDRPGEGARVLGALAAAGVNLLAAWGYPLGASGNARLELVPQDPAALRAAARKAKIVLKKEASAFHVSGKDKVGAVGKAAGKLAVAGVNIHALQAICAGSNYGCLIEVDAAGLRKAAKALGV